MFFKKKCPSCGTKNPKDATICVSCGEPFELRQAESPKAIKDYDEAIRLNPQSAEAYYKRGGVYHSLGQLERAIEDYDEVIRLNPEYFEAYINRGNVYYELGQFEQVIKDYDEVIRLNPKNDGAYFSRGLAYNELGKKAKAIADLEKFITLNDNPQWIKMARRQIEEFSK